ncbi:hypothetical protein MXL46_05505 [Heyndrickxia sporothermodurans]|uniref:hypothetical protein n=1 Tax=Heyndrickxia TaxID=2837504 RepID=UPI001F46B54A|nr:hypothetical protein [Heyndrickxia sporothermodurans]MEB6548563.1 hypothetical protein [Heyndrickxia sporothermodurans]MED3651868.1 hypothetical protein [Heyndrickxia sporothermodurans]MED3653565.1 hypothetical protein [Heyndrickxia sporothermodurans]MED3699518.1 hypothetical protein [Heyndrickxia sporothermodurans]MED3782579.1 hypothetical protein [Heyndrickxia sporothermodurans]
MPVENAHAAENYFAAKLGRGTGNRLAGESNVKTLVERGEQYTNGRKNRLKPNIRYKTESMTTSMKLIVQVGL